MKMIMLLVILSSILLLTESGGRRRLTSSWDGARTVREGADNADNLDNLDNPSELLSEPVGGTNSRRQLSSTWDDTSSWGGWDNKPYVKSYIQCVRGQVNMWFGGQHTFPYGWELCNGKDKNRITPDLSDKFIMSAGDMHPAWSHGGHWHAWIKKENLPNHKHTITDLSVSEEGLHDHGTDETTFIHDVGTHEHDEGGLQTEDGGEHLHPFDAETDEDGGHGHEFWLNATDAGNHNHGAGDDLVTEISGNHDHDNSFSINDEHSEHDHEITVDIADDGDHDHHFTTDDSVGLEILNHTHSVGDYTIDDHVFNHTHNVTGYSDKIGNHSHSIDVMTESDGEHIHLDDFVVDEGGMHWHTADGSLTALVAGNHSHTSQQQDTEEAGADHIHQLDAYFECSWDTHPDDCLWGLVVDKVDMGVHIDPVTGDSMTWAHWVNTTNTSTTTDHEHLVPQHTTSTNGDHTHNISGNTSMAPNHGHGLTGGVLTNDSAHYHQIDDDTEDNGEHRHLIWAKAHENHNEILDHTLSGESGPAGSADLNHTHQGTTDDGNFNHDHNGSTATTGNDGNHTHGLDGSVTENGNHTHPITGNTEDDGIHWHDITGYIGNETDGIHKHDFSGNTSMADHHNHNITGNTGPAGNHSHDITIVIIPNGSHTHNASGMTTEDDLSDNPEGIDIIPPFVSLWFICCTDDRTGHWVDWDDDVDADEWQHDEIEPHNNTVWNDTVWNNNDTETHNYTTDSTVW